MKIIVLNWLNQFSKSRHATEQCRSVCVWCYTQWLCNEKLLLLTAPFCCSAAAAAAVAAHIHTAQCPRRLTDARQPRFVFLGAEKKKKSIATFNLIIVCVCIILYIMLCVCESERTMSDHISEHLSREMQQEARGDAQKKSRHTPLLATANKLQFIILTSVSCVFYT
jgi:hypothetical protein